MASVADQKYDLITRRLDEVLGGDIIKAILALEKSTIPPNIYLKNPNMRSVATTRLMHPHRLTVDFSTVENGKTYRAY